MDEFACYMDTDSIKLIKGYNKEIIENYNKNVIERIKKVSKILKIPFDRFAPKDIKGKKHIIGLFESETKEWNSYTYDEFITQGAKKYAIKTKEKDKETGELKEVIKITVAGVPKKKGSKALKDLNDFRDDFIFESSITGKQTLYYIENQSPTTLIDCYGNKYINKDISGCAFVPCSYILGKSEEYTHLLTEDSGIRSWYKEVDKK